MSTPENETFVHFYATLIENLESTVGSVANQAYAASLLSREELGECLQGSLSDHRKASALIETIGLKVAADSDAFVTFLDILKKESCRDFLTEAIGKSLLTAEPFSESCMCSPPGS